MSASLFTATRTRNQRRNLDAFFTSAVAIVVALITLIAIAVAIAGDGGSVVATP